MSGPFRDDAVWRAQRAAELEADRKELEQTVALAETRIRHARNARVGPLFSNVRSVIGMSFIVVALIGGYVIGHYVVGMAAAGCF